MQPLEQRWVATAIVTRIDELFAIDAEARLPPKGSLRSSVRPGFLWKAVRLIRTSFPWGAFSDESLVLVGLRQLTKKGRLFGAATRWMLPA